MLGKPLKRKFLLKVLENNENSLNFFQNWGQIISGGAFLKLLLTNENISKHSARQSKLALNTP